LYRYKQEEGDTEQGIPSLHALFCFAFLESSRDFQKASIEKKNVPDKDPIFGHVD